MAEGSMGKGARITGALREKLQAQYAKRYGAGESIRDITKDSGRSYGFVHGILEKSGVALRGRGGATRVTAKKAATKPGPKKAAAKTVPTKAGIKKAAIKTLPTNAVPTKAVPRKAAPKKAAVKRADTKGTKADKALTKSTTKKTATGKKKK